MAADEVDLPHLWRPARQTEGQEKKVRRSDEGRIPDKKEAMDRAAPRQD
jgi:hypothetical protein